MKIRMTQPSVKIYFSAELLELSFGLQHKKMLKHKANFKT